MAEVTEELLHAPALELLVADPAAGAIVSFSGNVRDHDHGRQVATLTYEGHPSAAVVLQEVAADIASRFDVVALAVAHRVGPIPIGEAALVAAVSTAHRGEAFAACAALVDLVKERLPVWKHQVFADGSDEWVNCA
jgi:molybdopterin synthase catalytic subunit